MPTTAEALERLLVALLVGLLIGLDRERAETRKQRKLFAGVRTFPLIALLAGGLSLARSELGVWPLVAGLLSVAAFALVSYQRSAAAGEIGATTEIAALATYALGALAGLGQTVVAGAAGVTVAVLLAAKPRLEGLARGISEPELAAGLELAVISAIVLPLLPDRGYGPWNALNPFRIWWVVVLVSGVSFAGFVAARWKGDRAGVYLAATLGALVSSTATTAAMAARSRETPEEGRVFATAAVLASTVMCGRILVLVSVMGPTLLPRLALPIGAMALVGTGAAALLSSSGGERARPSGAPPLLQNPFSLRAAMMFGALYAGIVLLVQASQHWLGAKGTLLAAGLSGLADVDAISIALARGARTEGADEAVMGIVIAAASNCMVKAGIAVVTGAGRFRPLVAIALITMVAAGAAVAAPTMLAR